MDKALCFGTLGVGVIMFIVFLLDLIVGVPFGGKDFITGDILGLLASIVVVYLGWNAARDLS